MDAFNRGDLDVMLELARRGLRIRLDPKPRAKRGRLPRTEGFKEFVSVQWSMFDEFRVEAHELIPRGNHVVVPTTVRGDRTRRQCP